MASSHIAQVPCDFRADVLRALATFTDHTKSFAAFEFLADAPKEIAWNVLSWWDVKVPGE